MAKEQKPLLAAYLIVGEDQLKRAHMLKALTKRVSEKGDIEFNSATFSGDNLSSSAAIVDACNTIPFCSEVRLVVVKKADKLNKDSSELLVDYLKSPCDTTVLALEAEKLAKNTRLYKAVAALGQTAVIDCEPRNKKELPQLVRSMAVSHRVTISDSAAQRLIELVGTSTIALDGELAKLASYVTSLGIGEISIHHVDELVVRVAEVKPWELTDALSKRDVKECLTLLSRMPDQSPHGLLAMCLIRIRELITQQSLEKRPGSLSLAQVLGVPDWRVKNHAFWARGFKEGELVAILRDAADVEAAMKSGGDPKLVFESWVIRVCTGAQMVGI